MTKINIGTGSNNKQSRNMNIILGTRPNQPNVQRLLDTKLPRNSESLSSDVLETQVYMAQNNNTKRVSKIVYEQVERLTKKGEPYAPFREHVPSSLTKNQITQSTVFWWNVGELHDAFAKRYGRSATAQERLSHIEQEVAIWRSTNSTQ